MNDARLAEPLTPLSAFRLPLDGARMLWRERRLWPLAALPVALSVLAFATAIGVVVSYAPEFHAFATDWMPEFEASRWYTWLWIGPAKLALGAFGLILFLGIAAACFVLAYVVASVLASPFHDALAARVERILTGEVVDASSADVMGILRDAGRAVLEELRRTLFFLSVVVPIAIAGFVLPGAQLVAGPAITAFTVLFLPLDYASYTLDRRRVSFARKREWIFANKSVMAGFGAAAFLTCAVPGVNFFAMPLLVVGGTLLVLRASGAGAGTPTSP